MLANGSGEKRANWHTFSIVNFCVAFYPLVLVKIFWQEGEIIKLTSFEDKMQVFWPGRNFIIGKQIWKKVSRQRKWKTWRGLPVYP